MAITSVNEVVTDLYIALDQQYIDRQTFTTLYERANELAAKLNALIGTLTKSTARLR